MSDLLSFIVLVVVLRKCGDYPVSGLVLANPKLPVIQPNIVRRIPSADDSRPLPMALPALPELDNIDKENPDAVTAALLGVLAAFVGYYQDIFEQHGIEALIFPTTPRVAEIQGPEANSRDVFLVFLRNTEPGSHAGLPGLSIPGGLGSQTGMPVGI